FFFFYCSAAHRDLHSFPTRRSSDLHGRCLSRAADVSGRAGGARLNSGLQQERTEALRLEEVTQLEHRQGEGLQRAPAGNRHRNRSEEHTSELQSRSDLVCRLLLEKK